MTWAEACAALLEGKKVTRPRWRGGWIALEKQKPGTNTCYIRWNTKTIFAPMKEHLWATDWEVIPNENQ